MREEVAQVTKAELVEYVAGEVGLPKTQAEAAVNAVVDGIAKGLQKDGDVRLVGFGTFNVRSRKARQGRNPQTGETIMIKASKTVGFKAGKALKGAV
jgi:DNA-binding protein HU-beta